MIDSPLVGAQDNPVGARSPEPREGSEDDSVGACSPEPREGSQDDSAGAQALAPAAEGRAPELAPAAEGRAPELAPAAEGRAPELANNATTPQVFDFRKSKPAGEPEFASYELSRPVFFVGFMGAGKTSVARKLARNAGVAAVDMDTFIERRCDMRVKDIFAESGEAGFRAVETDVLRELATGDPRLVSCGGGVVLAQENRAILREHGFVVYLQVTAAEAASRISDVSTRPLFGDLAQAQRVIESRLPLYEEVADAVVDTAGRGTGSITREVLALLKREGVLGTKNGTKTP